MSEPLVDERGEPLEREKPRCPNCGSTETELVKGFGGYWKELCKGKGCVTVVAEGRGER